MSYKSICIFTTTGRTYTFKDVELLCDNESVLQFGYQAMSDGQMKIGTFPKGNIAGWSVTPNEEE